MWHIFLYRIGSWIFDDVITFIDLNIHFLSLKINKISSDAFLMIFFSRSFNSLLYFKSNAAWNCRFNQSNPPSRLAHPWTWHLVIHVSERHNNTSRFIAPYKCWLWGSCGHLFLNLTVGILRVISSSTNKQNAEHPKLNIQSNV